MNNYNPPLVYKIADDQSEFEQIHRLNYETFVEEIPQHDSNEDRRLIDRFNGENIYIIAKRNEEVIGMIAVKGNRPFSLDQKLSDLDSFLPEHAVPCEIRLLSIKKAFRGGRTFYGLCERLVSYCLEAGYTLALISGTLRQTKLYKHIGFQSFGPLVGSDEAPYQPMYLTKKNFERSSKIFKRLLQREEKSFYQNFLPGPVEIVKNVKEAWQKPAISHRSTELATVITDIRAKLCALTNSNHVELAVGTGTLANEMIAAQLSSFPGRGIILANGEFGERLIDHGKRWNLSFETLQKPWNTAITVQEVEKLLSENPEIIWLWTVHCETSTGYVYPLQELKKICQRHRVNLCVDACSSVGVIPVDLSGVYLASTVGGKGLASYPGIAIVFHEDEILPNDRIPNYLDIGKYYANNSIPFTHSSNGLLALQTALINPRPAKQDLAYWICNELALSGMEVLWEEGYSPAVISVALPESVSSVDFGELLKSYGIHTSYESSYLITRNWFQIALMGDIIQSNVMKAVRIIKQQFEQLPKEKVINR